MRNAQAISHAGIMDADGFLDVWSRTAPKYRRRAAVLLAVTVLLFAGLCCFTFWIRTGQYVPWADTQIYRDLMWKSVNPLGSNQITLRDFLLFPISVEQVPIQWVIMGLLLASLSSIPILVAILYRFPASVVLTAMVAGLAAMPWFGVTILLGCAIASLRPFRLSFRYASALLGLIPVAIYFVSATREPDGVSLTTPFRAKLAAPWVLAVLGSCIICAIALSLAKLINYRPGGIAPLLALLFAAPIILFHRQVGRDELEYRILEDRVGPGSAYVFVNRSLADEARKEATARWSGEKGAEFNALYQTLLAARIASAYELEAADCRWVEDRCETFLRRYRQTNSRYIPNVLYLRGRALDMRVDLAVLNDEKEPGLLQFHADVPHVKSRPVWESLINSFPENELAAYARYQLALLRAREGDLNGVQEQLDSLIGRFSESPAPQQAGARGEPMTIFRKSPASSTLGFEPAMVLRPGRCLRELIVAGRGDPAYGDAPLRELLALNVRDAQYTYNLANLIVKYPGSRLEPAVAARLALHDPSMTRAVENLHELADAYRDSPLQTELLYDLGQSLEQAGRLGEAREAFDALIAQHPKSCYVSDARRRLGSLSMLAAARPTPAEHK